MIYMLPQNFKSVITVTDTCYFLIGCRFPYFNDTGLYSYISCIMLSYSVECIEHLTTCVIVQLYNCTCSKYQKMFQSCLIIKCQYKT